MYCFFDDSQKREAINLSPGEHFISKKGMLMHTIIGSCVSVLIHDPVLKTGGMNHFMVQDLPEGIENSEYKDYAFKQMETLIQGLEKNGSKRSDLKAKLLGGSIFTDKEQDSVNNNIHFAEEFLNGENIEIIKRSTGGNTVRKIYYYPDSFRVVVKKMEYAESGLEKHMAEYHRRMNINKAPKNSKKTISSGFFKWRKTG